MVMNKRDAAFWIEHLRLEKHIEGGSFSDVYKSPLQLTKEQLPQNFSGDRHCTTHIYFLLEENQFSAFHRIKSDELWHFYAGDPLIIYEFDDEGDIIEHRLGDDPENHESFFCVIRAGHWFASRLAPGGEFALVGCSVSPGFDYVDFELAERDALIQKYPDYAELITELTR